MLEIFDIIPGKFRWLFWIAILAWYGIGWVAWRVQNDCQNRGYGPVATTFWSMGTLFLFFPVFPAYLLLRDRFGIKAGSPEAIQENPEGAVELPQILCPSCGQQNPAVLSNCLNCHQSLVPEQASGGMVGSVSCPVCGAQNALGTHHCHTCNAPI